VQDGEARLREEVRNLGERLGETLRASAGLPLYELVEEVRALAKRARAGDQEGAAALAARLASVTADEAHPLARAFAHFLALANVAESEHRARSAVAARRAGHPLVAALKRLRDAGLSADAIAEAAVRQEVELVLTAHPSQASRRTVLAKYERIAEALERLPEPEADAEIAREVAAAWHTDDVRRLRPTPLDEARTGLALFERTLWDAVPRFVRAWDDALRDVTGHELPIDATPIRFGSWMGGDRDGNPNVTAVVTERASLLARRLAAVLHAREIAKLGDALSIVTATPELVDRAAGAREPYRAVLSELAAKVETARLLLDQRLALADADLLATAAPPEAFLDPEDLARPLKVLYGSLHAVGLGLVADGALLSQLRRVAIFGTTLAPLDVRQHARVHEKALDALTRALDLGSWAEWDEAKRQAFLLAELGGRRPLVPRGVPEDEDLAELLRTLGVCARQPAGSLGAYVISGAATPSDVLVVYLLQREAGVEPPLRVVPLFETLQDLQNAPGVVDALLALPAFRERAADGLEIMIGYSDSAKDAGRVASAWALYEAQEKLVEVATRHGVALTLFHGRGGTIGRGGGPIALSIRSQPPGSIGERLRVTVQGESIDAAFALPAIAEQTFEMYVGAALESNLAPTRRPEPAWRAKMSEVARRSTEVYRAALDDPRFYGYFQAVTPERELSLLQIGSRPGKRGGSGGLGALRAIPWIFAWSQNRLSLPSWLGAHEALEAHGEPDRALLGQMLAEWPFFAALVDLLEMVAAKVDVPIASRYEAELAPDEVKPLGADFVAAFDRTRASILAVRGYAALLEGDPVLRWSIDVRGPYLQPLHLLQIELLGRLRATAEDARDPRLVDALLVTIHGIAAGIRNTG
jgi:phosphoenolpyruvate carboxylase